MAEHEFEPSNVSKCRNKGKKSPNKYTSFFSRFNHIHNLRAESSIQSILIKPLNSN